MQDKNNEGITVAPHAQMIVKIKLPKQFPQSNFWIKRKKYIPIDSTDVIFLWLSVMDQYINYCLNNTLTMETSLLKKGFWSNLILL